MINKGIICTCLLILLLILVITLQLYVDNFFKKLDTHVDSLEYSIQENKNNVNNKETNELITQLNEFWNKKITFICFMIDFKHISSIGESISRLQAGIQSNEYSACLTETKLLNRIIGALQKIFGLRLPNLL